MAVDFEALLGRFTAAVEAGDGVALGALFAPDGIYCDTFYGTFTGSDAIRAMLEERFLGHARNFRWDMADAVYDGRAGYARWRFSYTSTMPDSAGRRVVFEGMSRFEIQDGLIRRYDEVFDAGQAFAQLGMAPERSAKIFARFAADTVARARGTRHAKME